MLASAAAALLLRQSFDGTTQEDLRERVVSCVIFLRNTARKEVKEPWFLPVLLPTFGTVAKSRSRPETRNLPRAGARNTPAAGDKKEKIPLARLIRISMSLLFRSFLLYLV